MILKSSPQAVSCLIASFSFATLAFSEPVWSQETTTPEERMAIGKLELSVASLDRSGSAINQTVNPFSIEDDNFNIFRVSADATIPLEERFFLAVGASYENANDDDGVFFNIPTSDDDYQGSLSGNIQFGFSGDNYQIAGFGAGGRVRNQDVSDSDDQNSQFSVYGVNSNFHFGDLAIGLQAGRINSRGDDDETFSNGTFYRGIISVFSMDGRTAFTADFASGDAIQDYNSGSPDQLDVLAWGAEIEHQLDAINGMQPVSVFVSYRDIELEENETADNRIISAGVRFRSGGLTPKDYAQQSLPDLPNFGRWLGLTPAVD